MKKYILTLLCLFLGFYVVLGQAPTVSWPANYAVFQRNTTTTGGSSNVDFSGQIFSGYSTAKYRIEKLSKTGTFVSDYKAWQNLPTGSVAGMGTSTSALFHFTLANIPTGWYRFSIKNNAGTTTSVKFGVGEVFVIAGQSNAQGYGNYYNVYSQNLYNYDCVVSFKVNNTSSNYTTIERPVFGPLNNYNPAIGPMATFPWFYQYLGEKIVNHEGTNTVIPVCFFNTAVSGSSIDNWVASLNKTKKIFSNNYANSIVPDQNEAYKDPWGGGGSDNRFPYINLKNVLSYYCNLLGVRSVLWHQGEAETKNVLTKFENELGTYNNVVWDPFVTPNGGTKVDYYSNYNINLYASQLNKLITDTRAIVPGLTWAICKVSLTSEYPRNGGDVHKNITNDGIKIYNPQSSKKTSFDVSGSVTSQQLSLINSANKIVWASQNSDTYTFANGHRALDATHFNANGLKAIADEIYGNVWAILNKAPYLPKPILKLSYTGKSGSNFNLQATNTHTTKYLYPSISSASGIGFDQSASMLTTNTSSNSNTYQTGYGKDASGRIYLASIIQLGGISGARIISENRATQSMIFPNPSVANQEISIEFALEETAMVQIEIVDGLGKLLTVLEENTLQPDTYKYKFRIPDVETNDYDFLYSRLTINGKVETKRILITK